MTLVQMARRVAALPIWPERVRALLAPSDASVSANRARERQRRVLLTAGASAAAKAVSVVTMFVSVPLTLHYLGPERFGMWITISSFALMLSFADFGVGNGLLTAVSRASGLDDMAGVRAYVSTGAFVLAAIGLAAAVVGLGVVSSVDWATVFKLRDPLAMREAKPAMLAFVFCFAASIPLTLIQRVQFGLQRGFLSSLWQCISGVLVLATVLTAVLLEASLPILVAAFLAPPLVIGLVNSLVFFTAQMPHIAPRRADVSRRHGGEILRMGGLFFVLQVTVAVAYLSDNFVISRILGAAYVADYSIADRLFSVVSLLIGFVVMPLWPAFGEALTRGDTDWARRTLIRGTALSFAASALIAGVLLAGAPLLIRLWIGGEVSIPFALLAGMAVWRVIEAVANTASMYLNALQAVAFQLGVAMTTAIAALGLKVALVDSTGVWVFPWITAGCYLLFAGLPITLFLRRQFLRA